MKSKKEAMKQHAAQCKSHASKLREILEECDDPEAQKILSEEAEKMDKLAEKCMKPEFIERKYDDRT